MRPQEAANLIAIDVRFDHRGVFGRSDALVLEIDRPSDTTARLPAAPPASCAHTYHISNHEPSCTASHRLDLPGIYGGIQAGYNWHLARNYIAGIETDLQLTTGMETVRVRNFQNSPAVQFARDASHEMK